MNDVAEATPDNSARGEQRTRNTRLQDLLCGLLLVALALAVWLPLLTKSPSPGGDEPGFVDPAATFASHGVIGTTLYEYQLPGMDRHVYWQPPLYFVLLGLWLKAFGFGLVQARAFSIACGLVIVLCVFRLARHWAPPAPALTVSGLCVVATWVQGGARYARMDALCTALILLCALFYLNGLRHRGSSRHHAGAGLFAGLALLTHPLGTIAAVAVAAHQTLHRKGPGIRRPDLLAFAAPFLLCLAVWLAYIGQDVASFRTQMQAQEARRILYSEPPFWFWFFVSKIHVWVLALALLGGITLAVQRRRFQDADFLLILSTVALVAAAYGRLSYYFLYFFPLLCVAPALLTQTPRTRRAAVLGVILACGIELASSVRDFRANQHNNYATLADAGRAAIPAGKRVFLDFSYASLYFPLYGRNPVGVAAPVPLPAGYSLDRAVSTCDYLAVSTPLTNPSLRHWIAGKTPVATINQYFPRSVIIYRLR